MVFTNRRFELTYRSHIQGKSQKGPGLVVTLFTGIYQLCHWMYKVYNEMEP